MRRSLAPILLLAGMGLAQEAYNTAWSKHKFVTLNTTGTPAATNVTKFPVLIRLGTADSAIFNASQTNGADIRFTKLDNTTRLPHEIDTWDKAANRAAIWVLLDSVYGGTTGSRFRLHAGNPTAADSSKSSAVFDTANGFVAVWHMGGDSAGQVRANSVPGGNPAVPTGNTANLASGWGPRVGLIGRADSLRSQSGQTGSASRNADDHLTLGTGKYANFTTGLTISMWAKPVEDPDYTGWTQYISFSNGQATDNIWMGRQGGTTDFSAEVYEGTGSWGHVHASGVQVYDQWQHLAFTVDATGAQTLYHNGGMAAEGTGPNAVPNVERAQNHIGRSPWGDQNFLGAMDEVRVSKVARSATWNKLEYLNQNPTQTLVTLTDTEVPRTTRIRNASASVQAPALGIKTLNQGLLFQAPGASAGKLRVSIADMHGRTIWNHTAQTGAGSNAIVWNGKSDKGEGVGSGIYLVRMTLVDAQGKIGQTLVKRVPLTL